MEERRRRAQGVPAGDPLFGPLVPGDSGEPSPSGGSVPGTDPTSAYGAGTTYGADPASRYGANSEPRTDPGLSLGPAGRGPGDDPALRTDPGLGGLGGLPGTSPFGAGPSSVGTSAFGAAPSSSGAPDFGGTSSSLPGASFGGDPTPPSGTNFGAGSGSPGGTGYGGAPANPSAPGSGFGVDPLASDRFGEPGTTNGTGFGEPGAGGGGSVYGPGSGSAFGGVGGGSAFESPRGRGGVFQDPEGASPFSRPSDPAAGQPFGQPFERAFEKPESRPFEQPRPQEARNPFETRRPASRPFADQPGGSPFEPPRAPGRPFEPPRAEADPFETGRTSGNPFEPSRPQGGAPEAPRAEERSFEAFSRQAGGAFGHTGDDKATENGGKSSRPPKETRRSEPDPAAGRSKGPLFVAGGVVLLIAAVVGGIMFLNNLDDPAPPAATPATGPTAQAPIVGAGTDKYGFAASRKTDPQPLTLNELFGHKTVSAHGRSYVMTVRRADKKCKDAVHGTGIQKSLTAAGCTQFLRASFRDKPGNLIGTVGIANLKNAAASKKAAKSGSGNDLADYVTPLPGKDTATKLLGGPGESFATAWPQGHYLVMLWFQYKDGHKPSKAEMKRLNRAALDITEATVFAALDTRALTGARTN
ncbi:hypothetical protein DQ384_32785 [Sphaerisporangium album]|uniref:Uncharacterized protein n=2 Tax=Sphaerisporangium album TaxID=509200 RepID=A0A367F3I6_9ACTN|nr:hypothetical protein DQ384_32785 [Sphaerisporangium album]